MLSRRMLRRGDNSSQVNQRLQSHRGENSSDHLEARIGSPRFDARHGGLGNTGAMRKFSLTQASLDSRLGQQLTGQGRPGDEVVSGIHEMMIAYVLSRI